MIDVTKNKLDVKVKKEEASRVQEENEWHKRVEELAKIQKTKKKETPPKRSRLNPRGNFVRKSPRQQRAIGRQ